MIYSSGKKYKPDQQRISTIIGKFMDIEKCLIGEIVAKKTEKPFLAFQLDQHKPLSHRITLSELYLELFRTVKIRTKTNLKERIFCHRYSCSELKISNGNT
ncbi:hypothetical protein TNCT_83331 [Trichonephila clavata]|uniref:Uncharacterized protein n=1 Tax=Trichonephila clavata TaxID=2740835 RepID=A0A8X6GQT4_TRICU|nr:hypothetical protein TNCT_83331 [Trichonephila clavata]